MRSIKNVEGWVGFFGGIINSSGCSDFAVMKARPGSVCCHFSGLLIPMCFLFMLLSVSSPSGGGVLTDSLVGPAGQDGPPSSA